MPTAHDATSPGRASVNSHARLLSASAPTTPQPNERRKIHFEDGSSRSKRQRNSPLDHAGVLSYLLMTWVSPLINLGYKRPLEQEDLFDVSQRDEAAGLCRDFEREWNKQLQRQKPSLLRACAAVLFKRFFILTSIAYGVNIAVGLAQPYFLGRLVDYFAGDGRNQRDTYLLAMGFVLLSLLRAMVYHIGYFVGQRVVGMQVRTGLMALIHKKVLQLSHSALLKVTTGHVINLVSADVQTFDQVGTLVASLWWGPITVVGVMVMVYIEVGYSCFAGFAFAPFMLLFQYLSAKKMSQYRNQAAKQGDKRIRLMNEIISGMQLIKMYTWEKPFHKVVSDVRKSELEPIQNRWVLFALNANMNEIGIPIMSFLILTTYVYTGHELTASKAFTVVSLLGLFRVQVLLLQVFAFILSAESLIAFRRIQDFLILAETNSVSSSHHGTDEGCSDVGGDNLAAAASASDHRGESPVQPGSPSRHRIDMRQLCASWEEPSQDENGAEAKEAFKLQDITVSVSKGELLAVVGTVGAGKTSLLMTVLGELQLSSGSCNVRGDIGYAAQLAWIFSGTVRDNVLFGKSLDVDVYENVMSSCGLDQDIMAFSHGDLTLVGERGVKLSGGQKARIGLARALYQDAAVYLLDDPLSAVDAEVGQLIFDRCIRGLLRDKPVILVTHQLQYLSQATRILVLDEGKPLGTFSYSELLTSALDVAKTLVKKEDKETETSLVTVDKDKKAQMVSADEGGDEKQQEEDRAFGSVQWSDYWKFLRSGSSTVALVFVFVLCLVTQGSLNVSDWWLAFWTDNTNLTRNCTADLNPTNCTVELVYDDSFFVGVWGGLIGVAWVLVVCRGMLLRHVFVRASKSLHDSMLVSVLKAPMLFFNSHPSGRILNRFSKDINLLDTQMPWLGYDCIVWLLVMLALVLFVSVINPWTLIAPVPLAFVYIYLRRRYIKSSRELKRLEAVARSPVFSQFSATLQGLSTIRAFHAGHRLQEIFYVLLDKHSSGWLAFVGATRWLSVRLELMSTAYLAVVVFTSLLVFDYGKDLNLDAGTLGLSLAYQISFYGFLQWVVRTSADVENLMTSVERIFSYCDLEPEQEPALPIEPAADWPKYGIITGERMTFRYSPTGPAVLKAVNFCIRHKEKVGIVGRTGAGKSSFINALFRLSPTSGTVMIDGVALDQVLLETMREKMSIIPQDPVLYSGTLRYNLDPFGKHQDEDLWQVLGMVQMKGYVSQLQGGLSGELSESGTNFSVGQRQLICLARALLNRTRILLIDEATANVDNQTDAIIQQTLRTRFVDCTVVTIAHRLNTIMDSDRIMVIDNGKIKEFDEPLYLLEEKKDSVFAVIVNSMGEEEAKRLLIACQKKRYWTEEAADTGTEDAAALSAASAASSHSPRSSEGSTQRTAPHQHHTDESQDSAFSELASDSGKPITDSHVVVKDSREEITVPETIV